MNIRDLIDITKQNIKTYRKPNTKPLAEALDPIILALGKAVGIGNDQITDLYEDNSTLHITTYYVVKGCEGNNQYEIPSEIIDAEDPVKAAKLLHAQQQVEEATKGLKQAKQSVIDFENILAKAQQHLLQLYQ